VFAIALVASLLVGSSAQQKRTQTNNKNLTPFFRSNINNNVTNNMSITNNSNGGGAVTLKRGLIEYLFLKFGSCMFRELGDFEDSIYDSDNEGGEGEDESMWSHTDDNTVNLRGGDMNF